MEGKKKCLLKQDLAVLVKSLGVSIGLEVLLIYAAGQTWENTEST